MEKNCKKWSNMIKNGQKCILVYFGVLGVFGVFGVFVFGCICDITDVLTDCYFLRSDINIHCPLYCFLEITPEGRSTTVPGCGQ